MRMAKPIIIIAVLTLLGTPLFAKNAKTPKAVAEETSSPACSSYQADADGNWVQCPVRSSAPIHRPSIARARKIMNSRRASVASRGGPARFAAAVVVGGQRAKRRRAVAVE